MELDTLIRFYTVPPELSQRLAERLKDLTHLPRLALGEMEAAQFQKKKQDFVFYDTLGQYCGNELAALFESREGQAFHEAVMQVMTGERDGLVLKGLPTDVATKALIMDGMKALLASNELQYSAGRPRLLHIKPIDRPGFHRDYKTEILQHPNRSFMLMASAQETPFSAPTLFREVYTHDKGYAEHSLKPDEMILFNNKNLEHSSGVIDENNRGVKRDLLRLVITESLPSHSLKYMERMNHSRQKEHVPSDQESLKEWLLQRGEKLGTPTQGESAMHR